MAAVAAESRPPVPYGLGYQPGLDGLRAIAIGCVIAAHTFVPFTVGGGLAGVTAFVAPSIEQPALRLNARFRRVPQEPDPMASPELAPRAAGT